MSRSVTDVIAKAIKKADTSYIWENYTKQAHAAIDALHANDYVIIPMTPNKAMIKAGMEEISMGRTQVDDLTQRIYASMIKAACNSQ